MARLRGILRRGALGGERCVSSAACGLSAAVRRMGARRPQGAAETGMGTGWAAWLVRPLPKAADSLLFWPPALLWVVGVAGVLGTEGAGWRPAAPRPRCASLLGERVATMWRGAWGRRVAAPQCCSSKRAFGEWRRYDAVPLRIGAVVAGAAVMGGPSVRLPLAAVVVESCPPPPPAGRSLPLVPFRWGGLVRRRAPAPRGRIDTKILAGWRATRFWVVVERLREDRHRNAARHCEPFGEWRRYGAVPGGSGWRAAPSCRASRGETRAVASVLKRHGGMVTPRVCGCGWVCGGPPPGVAPLVGSPVAEAPLLGRRREAPSSCGRSGGVPMFLPLPERLARAGDGRCPAGRKTKAAGRRPRGREEGKRGRGPCGPLPFPMALSLWLDGWINMGVRYPCRPFRQG